MSIKTALFIPLILGALTSPQNISDMQIYRCNQMIEKISSWHNEKIHGLVNDREFLRIHEELNDSASRITDLWIRYTDIYNRERHIVRTSEKVKNVELVKARNDLIREFKRFSRLNSRLYDHIVKIEKTYEGSVKLVNKAEKEFEKLP